MITGCTFVTVLISVVAVIKIRSNQPWVFPFSEVAGLVTGCLIGGGAAVVLAWTLGGQLESRLPLRGLRIALAVVLFVLAVLTGLSARGIIG